MLYAYFDESERQGGVFCVAGFAFVPHQAKKFTKEWSRLFADYPGGLHMRHLAHCTGPFSRISIAEQRRLMVEAVKIINRRISAGFAVSCNLAEVELFAPKWIRGFGHAYPLCCHLAMIAVGNFLEKSGSSERVTYVFESGHLYMNEARDFMRNVVQNPAVKESYHTAGMPSYANPTPCLCKLPTCWRGNGLNSAIKLWSRGFVRFGALCEHCLKATLNDIPGRT